MNLPYRFRQVHGETIYNVWMSAGQPPFVQIIPKEPLGRIKAFGRVLDMDSTVTIVTVRCWNEGGNLQFEAVSPTDLQVAQDWNDRHNDTPTEDFKWVPDFLDHDSE